HGVPVDVLHVHVGRLVQRTQGPGPPGEGHVDGSHEDVEVLGVRDEDHEAGDDGDVQDHEGGLDHAVHARPEWMQPTGHGVGGEGPRVEGEVPGVDLARTVDDQGDHD